MIIYCDNENCEREIMKCTNTDSRQEWFEETYVCSICDKTKVHRREFNQLGLVTSDEINEGE